MKSTFEMLLADFQSTFIFSIPIFISSKNRSIPQRYRTNIAVSAPPIGNIYFEDNSSIKSKKEISKELVKLKSPNDSEQNIPTTVMTPPNERVAFCLDHPFSSMKYAVITSRIEIAEVSAAINRMKKNKVPQINPPPIWGNIVGKTTKIRPAPALGSAPMANTIVKIAVPASMAIAVSRRITQIAEFKRFCFLSK